MAEESRVVSIRFTGEEYGALQSLSLITGDSINSIIRIAAHEYLRRVVEADGFQDQVESAKARAADADARLRKQLGLTTAGT